MSETGPKTRQRGLLTRLWPRLRMCGLIGLLGMTVLVLAVHGASLGGTLSMGWSNSSPPGAPNGTSLSVWLAFGSCMVAHSRGAPPPPMPGASNSTYLVFVSRSGRFRVGTPEGPSICYAAPVPPLVVGSFTIPLWPLSASLTGMSAWAVWLRVNVARRARRGACPTCGYDLSGLIPLESAKTCPECGRLSADAGAATRH